MGSLLCASLCPEMERRKVVALCASLPPAGGTYLAQTLTSCPLAEQHLAKHKEVVREPLQVLVVSVSGQV